MDEAGGKPKILLLRKAVGAEASTAWGRFAKALKSFTDFEERETDTFAEIPEGFDHVFLDAELAGPKELQTLTPKGKLTLVHSGVLSWGAPAERFALQSLFARVPLLVLESLSAGDLLRVVHTYLVPKRLGGVAPLMEKGSQILGEKLMDMNTLGLLLDKLSTFLDVDNFALKSRVSDLRQVLSALVVEGLRCAKESGAIYPSVDFQVSASSAKIAVCMRFPLGKLAVATLPARIVAGADPFWSQAYQCSDITLVTHHEQHAELELTLLLHHPTRPSFSACRSILFQKLEKSPKKASALEAPENYVFKLISELKTKESGTLVDGDGTMDTALGEIKLDTLPPELAEKVGKLNEKLAAAEEQLARKETMLRDASAKAQQLSRDLNQKRGEVIRASKSSEAGKQVAERRVRELETKLADMQRRLEKAAESAQAQASDGTKENLKQLEGQLRMNENERTMLRESLAGEQRKLGALEQKYTALHRDLGQKEREITELKAAMLKQKKEAASGSTAAAAGGGGDAELAAKLKEAEAREAQYKTELKKNAHRVETAEKTFKAAQTEAVEKIRVLDGKLKDAKTKEMEMLRKIEELTAALKKAKAA